MLIDLGRRKYQVIGVVYSRGKKLQLGVTFLYPDHAGHHYQTSTIPLDILMDLYLPKFDLVIFLHDEYTSTTWAMKQRDAAYQRGVLGATMQLRYRNPNIAQPAYKVLVEAATRHFLESHGIDDTIYHATYMTEDRLDNLPLPAHMLVQEDVHI